jgi:hypothetical protein
MRRTLHRIALPATDQHLSVIGLHAARPGPTIVITANIHGDECTGVGAVLSLIPVLEQNLSAGAVHLYPSLNPMGLEQRSRKIPEEDQDLNRLFPGERLGSPAERQAHCIWADLIARKPTLVIDLHSDAPESIPYALLDRATSLKGIERSLLEGQAQRIAEASGLTILHEYPDDRYSRFRLDRSLSGAVLNRLKIPAVTVECGPRLHISHTAVQTMQTAVLRMLQAMEVLPSAPPATRPPIPGHWRRDSGPRAATEGILLARAPVGGLLHRGDLVAEIYGLSGELRERLSADAPGFVVAYAERSHVLPGVAVCTYALRE